MAAEILSGLTPNQRFWIVIQFAIFISAIEAFAQLNIKNHNIFLGFLGYTIIVFVLYKAYNYEGLGHMNLVWSCLSIIIAYIVGYIYFKEKMNKYTFIAVIFALLAIYFAHLSDE